MPNVNTESSDRRSQVHTETHRPIEVVLSRLVMYVFGLIEILIAIRFVLKLLGANAEAGFVKLMYSVSDIFMVPFTAIFTAKHAAGATFELSALAAIAVYALVAWGVVMLIRVISPRENAQTVERVETDKDVRVP
jgi:hypothetical protein